MEKRGATGSFGRFGECVVRRMSRKGGWVGLERSGRRSVVGGGGVHARLHESFCLHPFAVEQPAAENVGRPRLAVLSFYVRLALATLALRETSSAVTPAFRFPPLCRLISSPLQPFWEFLSSVLCGGFLCFAFLSLSSHSVRYFPVVPGYSGVKEISHHTYPTLEISH